MFELLICISIIDAFLSNGGTSPILQGDKAIDKKHEAISLYLMFHEDCRKKYFDLKDFDTQKYYEKMDNDLNAYIGACNDNERRILKEQYLKDNFYKLAEIQKDFIEGMFIRSKIVFKISEMHDYFSEETKKQFYDTIESLKIDFENHINCDESNGLTP